MSREDLAERPLSSPDAGYRTRSKGPFLWTACSAAKWLSRWAAPAALLLALIAVGLAVWVLLSASSKAPVAAHQAGDPKARVCMAFPIVSQAVQIQPHADLGPDPIAQTAVAGNARLSLIGGGEFLLSQVDDHTPPELADAVRCLRTTLVTSA